MKLVIAESPTKVPMLFPENGKCNIEDPGLEAGPIKSKL